MIPGHEPENHMIPMDMESGIITQATPDQVKIMTVEYLMIIRCLPDTDTMGIDYARENGADVMNMSLGHTSPTDSELKLINDSMEKSVKQGSVFTCGIWK